MLHVFLFLSISNSRAARSERFQRRVRPQVRVCVSDLRNRQERVGNASRLEAAHRQRTARRGEPYRIVYYYYLHS